MSHPGGEGEGVAEGGGGEGLDEEECQTSVQPVECVRSKPSSFTCRKGKKGRRRIIFFSKDGFPTS